QIILGDKSHLLLWKEILIKAYVSISSQRKEVKWYTDIRNLITSESRFAREDPDSIRIALKNRIKTLLSVHDQKIFHHFVKVCTAFISQILELDAVRKSHERLIKIVKLIEKHYG
ncbi:1024_t:CDS:1, partial [Rhizophagus irregularis]